ncbi:MAG: hypothetical protein ACTSU6_03225 [Candidatus Njordarchaeales archaeon]
MPINDKDYEAFLRSREASELDDDLYGINNSNNAPTRNLPSRNNQVYAGILEGLANYGGVGNEFRSAYDNAQGIREQEFQGRMAEFKNQQSQAERQRQIQRQAISDSQTKARFDTFEEEQVRAQKGRESASEAQRLSGIPGMTTTKYRATAGENYNSETERLLNEKLVASEIYKAKTGKFKSDKRSKLDKSNKNEALSLHNSSTSDEDTLKSINTKYGPNSEVEKEYVRLMQVSRKKSLAGAEKARVAKLKILEERSRKQVDTNNDNALKNRNVLAGKDEGKKKILKEDLAKLELRYDIPSSFKKYAESHNISPEWAYEYLDNQRRVKEEKTNHDNAYSSINLEDGYKSSFTRKLKNSDFYPDFIENPDKYKKVIFADLAEHTEKAYSEYAKLKVEIDKEIKSGDIKIPRGGWTNPSNVIKSLSGNEDITNGLHKAITKAYTDYKTSNNMLKSMNGGKTVLNTKGGFSPSFDANKLFPEKAPAVKSTGLNDVIARNDMLRDLRSKMTGNSKIGNPLKGDVVFEPKSAKYVPLDIINPSSPLPIKDEGVVNLDVLSTNDYNIPKFDMIKDTVDSEIELEKMFEGLSTPEKGELANFIGVIDRVTTVKERQKINSRLKSVIGRSKTGEKYRSELKKLRKKLEAKEL